MSTEEIWKNMVEESRELKEDFREFAQDHAIIYAADEIESLRQQLAATQAANAKLRKAFGAVVAEYSPLNIRVALDTLALPADDTALKEYVRKKCVKGLNYMADKWLGSPTKETYEGALNEVLKGE